MILPQDSPNLDPISKNCSLNLLLRLRSQFYGLIKGANFGYKVAFIYPESVSLPAMNHTSALVDTLVAEYDTISIFHVEKLGLFTTENSQKISKMSKNVLLQWYATSKVRCKLN